MRCRGQPRRSEWPPSTRFAPRRKDRRLGASNLTLAYPTLPYLRKVRMQVQLRVSRSTRLRHGRARGSRLLLGGRSLGRVRPEAVGRVVEHVEHVAALHVHHVVEGGDRVAAEGLFAEDDRKIPLCRALLAPRLNKQR